MAIFFPNPAGFYRIGRRFKHGFKDASHTNGASGGSVSITPPNGDDFRGMFVWITSDPAQDPLNTLEKRETLLNFCINKNINRLYIDTYQYLGPATTDDTKKTNMRSFLSSCYPYGISVYGLGGNTDWTSGSTHGWISTNIINPLLDFNTSGNETEQFQGYCLDVEYWTTIQPPVEAIGGLDTLINIFNDEGIEPHLFTAFYLMDNSGSRATFSYNGKNVQDGEHLMDILAEVNGTVVVGSFYDIGGVQASYTEAWTDYSALSASINIFSSAETIDIGSDVNTYFEEGETIMNTELSNLSSYFADVPVWKGIIIHNYDGYTDLSE